MQILHAFTDHWMSDRSSNRGTQPNPVSKSFFIRRKICPLYIYCYTRKTNKIETAIHYNYDNTVYFHHKCMRYDTCNTAIILPNPTLKTSNVDTHLRCPQPSGDAQTYSCGSIWVTWLSCRGSPGKSSVHRIPHKDHGWCTEQIWGKVEKGEGQDEVAVRHWVCCHIFSHAAVTRVHNFFMCSWL